MTAPRAKISSSLAVRRGLRIDEAAAYLGLGVSYFRELVEGGTMPRPHIVGSRRIWDIDDLDAAFKALPVEGERAANPWDEAAA